MSRSIYMSAEDYADFVIAIASKRIEASVQNPFYPNGASAPAPIAPTVNPAKLWGAPTPPYTPAAPAKSDLFLQIDLQDPETLRGLAKDLYYDRLVKVKAKLEALCHEKLGHSFAKLITVWTGNAAPLSKELIKDREQKLTTNIENHAKGFPA